MVRAIVETTSGLTDWMNLNTGLTTRYGCAESGYPTRMRISLLLDETCGVPISLSIVNLGISQDGGVVTTMREIGESKNGLDREFLVEKDLI